MALNKSCWPLWRIEMDALISWIVPLERPLSNPMGPQAANSIAQRTSSKTCVYCDSIICFLFFRVNQRRPQSGVQTLWGLQPAIGCIPWSWICTLDKWQAVETRFCSKNQQKNMLSWCHILYVWLNMEQAGKSIIMVCHMNESTYPNITQINY